MSKSLSKSSQALLKLRKWFDAQARVLPWRSKPTLYRVWISEIMLQQTQVATVLPYFERFMKAFPKVESLAAAQPEEVIKAWEGLGYYSRARNLHAAAWQIGEKGWPRTREGWLEIPGVGPYTAGAICSIALNQPEAILDGNVERVLSRLRMLGRAKGDASYKARLWNWAGRAVRFAARKGVEPRVFNQALMELGATLCSPRAPRCELCPLEGICKAHRSGDPQLVESYPEKKAKKEWLFVEEELHAWICGKSASRRVLLELRGPGQWRAGLWDLSEAAPPAGRARLQGSVTTKHIVTRHKITRTTHVWQVSEKEMAKRASSGKRWVCVEAPEVPVGAALRKSLELAIRSAFSSVSAPDREGQLLRRSKGSRR